MSKKRWKMPMGEFMKRFHNEKACREYLDALRWNDGFVCPKCGHTHAIVLSNGMRQCSDCHHQISVTSGTVMHKTHVRLTTWFLSFYLSAMDKRGISAVQLANMTGVTYKTAWYMLKRIRSAMGQRDAAYLLAGVIEFDDTYFGGPKAGSKRGRGTAKVKVFVALSLDENGNPRYVKLRVTGDLTQRSVKQFANQCIEVGSTIQTDGFSSYIPALTQYNHEHENFDPKNSMLRWLHIIISNAKTFILGTYHGLPSDHLQSYLDEFAFRFSRRNFKNGVFERLALAISKSNICLLS